MATSPSSFLSERDLETLSAPTISVDDFGRVFGIGRSSAYAAVRSGEVPSIRVGRRVRVPSAWVRAQLRLDHIEGAPVNSVSASQSV